MARINNLNNFLTDVADAIRAKTGGIAQINAEDFDTEILSIPTGGGGDVDVKLFPTEQAMQADTNKHEGDLALVYGTAMSNLEATTEFSTCMFPQEVVVPTAITSSIYLRFESVITPYSGTLSGTIRKIALSLSYRNSSGVSISITYTSSDGITYTRTDENDSIIQFDTTFRYRQTLGVFDSRIGYFMRVPAPYFGGVFKCTQNDEEELEYTYAETQLTLDNANQLTTGAVGYGNNGIITGDGSFLDTITVAEFLQWFNMSYSSPATGNVVSSGSIIAPCLSFSSCSAISPYDTAWNNTDLITAKRTEYTTDEVTIDFPYKSDYIAAPFTFGTKVFFANGMKYGLYVKGSVDGVSDDYYSSVTSVIYYCINLNTGELVSSGKYATAFTPVSCYAPTSEDTNRGCTNSDLLGFDIDTNTLYIMFVAKGFWQYQSKPVGHYGIFSLKDTTGNIVKNYIDVVSATTANMYGKIYYDYTYFDFKDKVWIARCS